MAYLFTTLGLRVIFPPTCRHLPLISPRDAPARIRRSARAGSIVIVTPNLRASTTVSESFCSIQLWRPYPPALVSSMLEDHGFVSVESGRGAMPYGLRSMPRVLLGRVRYGREFGVTEMWIRGVKPDGPQAADG